jgi:ATP-dependent DNA helicase RecG
VRFKGTSRVHIIDDKFFDGSLLQQYIQAEKWIKDKLEVRYIIEGMGPRKEIWEIPLPVFKEAIINALSHRDYYQAGAVTMIEVYDDRVEISNPGSLLAEVKKEFGRKSATRNPLIFDLFTRMDLVEQVASGIPRMREDMEEAKLPEPTFRTDGGFFTVVFQRPKRNNAGNSDVEPVFLDDLVNDPINAQNVPINVPVNVPINFEERIFELVRNKEGISAPEITAII